MLLQSSSFESFLQTDLNEVQRQAVLHTHGSLLVVAGAGSGKTRVITARITNLMRTHMVPASQIVALTFTNKAAHEMKERIKHFIGNTNTLPFIGTFHAYCMRLLKQFEFLLPQPFMGILDTADQHALLKAIVQKYALQKQTSISQIAHYISQLKNQYCTSAPRIADHTNPFFAEIYHTYEQEKRASHYLDFDDLLLETVRMFKHESFKTTFHNRVRHVLVDEYQDTNIVQHQLLKQMCIAQSSFVVDSVCAVGDEDQSIYSWRGATIANMQTYAQDFPDTRIIKIEQNYRSQQSILDIANAIIKCNTGRTPKQLWSLKRETKRVCMLIFASEYQEADSITQLCILLQETAPFQDCAILYRTHAQSRIIEEALVKYTIPYRIIGGTQFYDRMEIRDLLAYLKLIVNPFDRIACARALNTPPRGLGTKAEEQFFAQWDTEPLSDFKMVIHQLCREGSAHRMLALKLFLAIFDDLPATHTASYLLEQIIIRTQFKTYLQNSYEKDEAIERIANIDELMNACLHAESMGISTITQFLEQVALMNDHVLQMAHEKYVISLMTLHAAKGLEFDTVILVGLEEGILPTVRATYDPLALEEERRLLYVGITRARERLLFTRVQCRRLYGKVTEQKASRFVQEMPNSLVPSKNASLWRTSELRSTLRQLLE
jgi:DNA helicase II / ATP-dependent DNA helicase PcrA